MEAIIFVIGLVAIVDRNVQSIGIQNTKIYYLLILALSILSLSLIKIVDRVLSCLFVGDGYALPCLSLTYIINITVF